MKRLWMVVAAGLLWCVAPALARLGETKDQCAVRYGSIVATNTIGGPSGVQFVYSKNGYLTGVCYISNVCEALSFTRIDDRALTTNEIEIFKTANKAGSAWAPIGNSMDALSRVDERAFAVLAKDGKVMNFYSKTYIDMKELMDKSAEQERLSGF